MAVDPSRLRLVVFGVVPVIGYFVLRVVHFAMAGDMRQAMVMGAIVCLATVAVVVGALDASRRVAVGCGIVGTCGLGMWLVIDVPSIQGAGLLLLFGAYGLLIVAAQMQRRRTLSKDGA